MHDLYKTEKNLYKVIRKAANFLKGNYAVAIFSIHEPNKIYAMRIGSPLILGVGIEENFIASDQLALLPVTNKFVFLEEGDVVVLSRDNYDIYDKTNSKITREIVQSNSTVGSTSLGDYQHFMHKEIEEQPMVLLDTIRGNITEQQILDSTFGLKSTDNHFAPQDKNLREDLSSNKTLFLHGTDFAKARYKEHLLR